jgi:hypothetical protein
MIKKTLSCNPYFEVPRPVGQSPSAVASLIETAKLNAVNPRNPASTT